MQTHPFINSVLCRMAGVALAVVSCSISALLLYYYGHTGWLVAWLDSLVSVGIFCVSGFLFWYVTGILRPLQAQIALAVGVLIISVTGGYMAGALVYPDRMDWFASTIPFRILLGLLGWIILAQWYYIRWKELQMGDTGGTEKRRKGRRKCSGGNRRIVTGRGSNTGSHLCEGWQPYPSDPPGGVTLYPGQR